MTTTGELSFVGSSGSRLSGVLHEPDGPVSGSVLMAHCFTCSKDLFTMTRFSAGLADAGYVSFRFDFTGLGESEGRFETTTVSHNLIDLTRAAVTLIERGFGPCALFGHSLGGAAVLLAAHRLKTVRAVAVLGAPADADHVLHFAGSESTVTIGGRTLRISPDFASDAASQDAAGLVAELDRPLLVLHAVDDETVPFENAELIYERAKEPKRLVALEAGDHLLSDRAASDVAIAELAKWFDEVLA